MAELIRAVKAIKILNSRGEETIKVSISSDNYLASFSAPAGKSTGKYEMSSLAADVAISNIKNKIFPLIKEREVDFKAIDKLLIENDDTLKRRELGANAILGISVALARLQAKIQGKTLSEFLSGFFEIKENKKLTLLMNIIEGGVHSFGGPAFQEYLILIKEENIKDSVFLGAKIYREIGKTIKSNTGDEGGYAIDTKDVKEPLKKIWEIIEKEGAVHKIKLGIDVAATQIFDGKNYNIDDKQFSSADLKEFYLELLATHHISYLEDPFYEDDFNSFADLNKRTNNCLVVGDDLTVTNSERLKKAIETKSISGIIIKPNQIGTLSETIKTINTAKENDIEIIISHRSGETNDSFIVDLALAANSWGLKAGAPAGGERVAKYNKLIESQ